MGPQTPESAAISVATPSTDIKGRAVRGSAATVGGQMAQFVIATGATAVMARILAPSDYGTVTMVVAFLGLATLFKDLGLSVATVQRQTITHEEVSGLFWVNVFTGTALMLVMMACAPLVGWFYRRPDLYWLTLAYAALTPVSGLGAQHQALLQRSMRYATLAVRGVVAAAAGAVAGIWAAVSGLGYWSLFIAAATTAVVGTLTLWWQSGWRPGRPRHPRELAPLLAFGGALTLSNVLAYVVRGLDLLLLGHFSGAFGLGLYARAQGILVKPMDQVVPPVLTVATGTFSRLSATPERFASAAFRFLGALSFVAGLVTALVVGCAHWIVAVLLGPQWTGAVPIVRALALFALVEPCCSFLSTLLVVRGQPLKLVRWRVVSTLIILGGLVVGLPWGPLGVALAMSGTGLLLRAPLFFVYSGRALGLGAPRIFRTVGSHVLCGFAVAAGLLALDRFWPKTAPVLGLLSYAALGTVLYVALSLVSREGRAVVSDLWSTARTLDPRTRLAAQP
jgi:PST family polysaccharide transporter